MGAASKQMHVQEQGAGLRAEALELEWAGLFTVRKSSAQPRASSQLLHRALVKKG